MSRTTIWLTSLVSTTSSRQRQYARLQVLLSLSTTSPPQPQQLLSWSDALWKEVNEQVLVEFDLGKDVEVLRDLGKGAYGQVQLGRVHKNGAQLAIKRLIGVSGDGSIPLKGRTLAETAVGSRLIEVKILSEQAGQWCVYLAKTESGEEVLVREYVDSTVDYSTLRVRSTAWSLC
jgi:hypothetical protein